MVLYPLNSKFGGREIANRNPPAILMGVRPAIGPGRRPGEAYEFTGRPNSFIKIPNNGRLDTVKAITVLISVLPKSRQGPIFQFSETGYGFRLWMMRRNMVIAEFVSRSPRIKKPYLASIKIKPWKWNVVGMSYDKTTGIATLFVNNVPVIRKKLGHFDLATNYPVFMGAKPGDKRVFRGRVSCLQIFDKALNTAQVSKAGRACFKKGKLLIKNVKASVSIQLSKETRHPQDYANFIEIDSLACCLYKESFGAFQQVIITIHLWQPVKV